MNPLFFLSAISPQIKLALVSALCIASFCAGWQIHSWKIEAGQAHSIAKAEKTRQNAIVKVDKIIDTTQKREAEVKIVYRTIREKINDQNDNRICFTSESIKLWNDAISGENSHRSEPVAKIDTAGSANNGKDNAEVVASVKQVLTNASENYQICNENAIKHDALVDVLEVYKGKMCVCSE